MAVIGQSIAHWEGLVGKAMHGKERVQDSSQGGNKELRDPLCL